MNQSHKNRNVHYASNNKTQNVTVIDDKWLLPTNFYEMNVCLSWLQPTQEAELLGTGQFIVKCQIDENGIIVVKFDNVNIWRRGREV